MPFLTPVINNLGHCAGRYDAEGNFGLVIAGEPTYQALVKRAESLGYVIRERK